MAEKTEKKEVVEEVKEEVSPAVQEVNRLVANAVEALDEFMKLDQELVDYIVE